MNIQENSTLQKHYDELSAQYKGKTSRIDKDIYSQLEYAKERYLLLRYLIFKLTTRHEDIVLIQTIQNLAMELLTKIRHLLDHSFGRFVKLCIYRPNGYEAIDFNYPCTSSETQLEEQLGSKQDNDRSLFSTDNNKKSIKRDYPAVYAALCETQPFYYYNPEKSTKPQFLSIVLARKIISLCNAAKHVGLLSPSPKDLLDWWQKQIILHFIHCNTQNKSYIPGVS
ncbi:MAG: hypothetical protein HWD59_10570 [Coxiellaceae bacterium]|nr:MAG: hypothetical protein HWD59_10570 [Coxiellaceae bacterium]